MSERLHVAIVDDEAAARSRIRKLLHLHDDVLVVAEAANGRQAVEAVSKHRPDVLFLDVQMPGLDGFGVLRKIARERLPAVVFVTAYDQYALRAFEARAVDYLLKPFDDERFADVLDNVRRRVREGRSESMRAALLDLLTQAKPRDAAREADDVARAPAEPPLERIPVPERGRIHLVDVESILWIEAAGDYACLHAGKARHLVRGSLADLERRLGGRFLRVHRSALVRRDAVAQLAPRTHGDYDLVLTDGTALRLSRQYRAAFVKAIGLAASSDAPDDGA